MKTKNPTTTLMLFSLLFSFAINAQTVVFTYDEAGNRLSQALEIKKIRDTDSSDLVTEQKSVMALIEATTINDIEVIVSPNPNGGKFDVRMSGVGENTDIKIYLHSMSGKLIFESKPAQLITTIDITNRENGTYLLTIAVKGTKETWKVIKQ